MPSGIEGSYNNNTSTLELLQGLNNPADQQQAASNRSAAEVSQQEEQDNPAQIRVQDTQNLETAEHKHSRNLIDTYA
ncbi:MAG: hypothetical protein GY940_06510 [bacterium]|nr:hypothetical protein [bacterium]